MDLGILRVPVFRKADLALDRLLDEASDWTGANITEWASNEGATCYPFGVLRKNGLIEIDAGNHWAIEAADELNVNSLNNIDKLNKYFTDRYHTMAVHAFKTLQSEVVKRYDKVNALLVQSQARVFRFMQEFVDPNRKVDIRNDFVTQGDGFLLGGIQEVDLYGDKEPIETCIVLIACDDYEGVHC